jgi:hypothetical protein
VEEPTVREVLEQVGPSRVDAGQSQTVALSDVVSPPASWKAQIFENDKGIGTSSPQKKRSSQRGGHCQSSTANSGFTLNDVKLNASPPR